MADDFPIILTLHDAASILLTTPDVLQAELEAGRLQGFRVGNEWRTTKQALLNFIGQTPSPKPEDVPTKPITKVQGEIDMSNLMWRPAEPFTYHWPKNAKDPKPNTEYFDTVFTADLKVGNLTYPLKIAYTYRKAFGQERRRVVVFIKHNVAVEFAGADDFETTGLLASSIRDKDGKYPYQAGDLPVEYATMPVDVFTNLITGPNTKKSIAVIASKDDFTTIARHAIVRAQWKNWID